MEGSQPQISTSRTFVGRRKETAELWQALEDMLAGQGRVAILAGDAGIGKTRIAQELSNHAISKGVMVLWGQCLEDEGTPPY